MDKPLTQAAMSHQSAAAVGLSPQTIAKLRHKLLVG
jgi:hypothetical protein